MEENVFPHPAVAGSLERTIEARLHNDGDVKERVKQLQQRFTGSLATPSYVILDPKTEQVVAKHLGPQTNEKRFGAWLEEHLD